MRVRFFLDKNKKPLTPCCKASFMAVPDKMGYSHCYCKNCFAKFDMNLRQLPNEQQPKKMQ